MYHTTALSSSSCMSLKWLECMCDPSWRVAQGMRRRGVHVHGMVRTQTVIHHACMYGCRERARRGMHVHGMIDAHATRGGASYVAVDRPILPIS